MASDGKITRQDLVTDDAIAVYAKLKTEAVAALKAIATEIAALEKARKVLGNTTKENTNNEDRRKKKLTEAEKIIRQTTAAEEKLKLTIQGHTKALITARAKTTALNAEMRKSVTGAKKARSAFRGLFGSVKSLIGAFGVIGGIQLFASITKNAFELIKTFDSLGFALEKITKNSFDAAVSQRFLMEITMSFGTELVTTTNRWIKFLAAAKQSGLTLLDTENIFRTMTKASAVLGLKTDELTGIYLALEQMLSKGKVTTEELRRQLGERLPGAMGIMAASLGVTISQLDKMLKKGEVLSADALPKFAKAVEIAYGIETVDKVETLVASQNKLTTAWQLFVKNVTSNQSFLTDTFKNLTKAMEFFGQIFFTDQQKRQLEIIESKKAFEKEMYDEAKKGFDKTLGLGMRYQEIRNKIDSKNIEIGKNLLTKNSDDRDKILQQELADLTSTLIGYNENITKIEKGEANNKIAAISKLYNMYAKIIKGAEKTIADEKAKGIGNGELYQTTLIETTSKELESARKIVIANRGKLISYTAQLEVLKKLKEVGVSVVEPDKAKGVGSKHWIDHTAPETIKWYKEIIAFNQKLIEETTDTNKIIEYKNEITDARIEMQKLIDLTKGLKDAGFADEAVDDIHILKQGIKDYADMLGGDGEQALKMYLDKHGETFNGISEFYEKLNKLAEESAKKRAKIEEDSAEFKKEIEQGVFDFVSTLTNSIFELKIQKIDDDIQKNNDYYDSLINASANNNEEQAALEREKDEKNKALQKKREDVEKKAFLFNKAFQIGEIALETVKTVAALKLKVLEITAGSLLNPFLAPLIAPAAALIPLAIGSGIASAATVAAQAIPAFKDGTDNAPKGLAIVGDGGRNEYIEKNGQIFQTPSTDTLINLSGGEKIHKDLDSLAQSKGYDMDSIYKATVLTSLASENKLSTLKLEKVLENNLKDLDKKMAKGIKDGFSKVQMHNHTTVDLNHALYSKDVL